MDTTAETNTKLEARIDNIMALVHAMTPAQLQRVRDIRECNLANREVFIYVGRYNSLYRVARSIFCNDKALNHKDYDGMSEDEAREANLRDYIRTLLTSKKFLLNRLLKLKDKVLMCWCCDQRHGHRLCHAMVLIVLVDQMVAAGWKPKAKAEVVAAVSLEVAAATRLPRSVEPVAAEPCWNCGDLHAGTCWSAPNAEVVTKPKAEGKGKGKVEAMAQDALFA